MMRFHLPFPVLAAAFTLSCVSPPGTDHVVAEGALGPYSAAVLSGDFVWVSGKIGERGGEFEHEVETAIDAVEDELANIGLTLGDVVEALVFLTDIDDYGRFNEIYGRRFPAPYPARACVSVAALPAGARVEVKVIARR